MGGHKSHLFDLLHSFCIQPQKCNPFSWSNRQIHIAVAILFSIIAPVYIFIGLQPVLPANAADFPRLSISSINLDIPVEPLTLDNHQLNVPDNIAGSYSQNQHKTLLVGHSSTAFRKLNRLQPGQIIKYKDKAFLITETTTLAKSDVNMSQILSDRPQDTLILMTCAGDSLPNQDATHRLIINAVYFPSSHTY